MVHGFLRGFGASSGRPRHVARVNPMPGRIPALALPFFGRVSTGHGAIRAQGEIVGVYGRQEAYEGIRQSQEDYRAQYPSLESLMMRPVERS